MNTAAMLAGSVSAGSSLASTARRTQAVTLRPNTERRSADSARTLS
nr:hypothetical protein [Saccharopolyspora terrae]